MTNEMPQGDTDEAIKFLKAWPVPFPHLTAIHVDQVTKEKARIEAKSFPPAGEAGVPWNKVAAWIEGRQGEANIYFNVNSLRQPMTGRTKKTDIAEVVAFHVDIDTPAGEDVEATVAALVAKVLAYKLEPSHVIASGGGVQAFWVLPKSDRLPVDGDLQKAQVAEQYTRAIEADFSTERGAKADACFNCDRIMRVPFTVNVPDKKKVDKGRKPALAVLVHSVDVKHPIGGFAPAPPSTVQVSASALATLPAEKKFIVEEVNWELARQHYNTLPIEVLRTRGVAEHALLTLEKGDNLTLLHAAHVAIGHRVNEGAYDSYSLLTLSIATALLKAGLDPHEAAAVMSDPAFPGNKHVNKQKDLKMKHRAVERAIKRAATDIVAQDKRVRATLDGVPQWIGTVDDAGLIPKTTLTNTEIAIRALGVGAKLDRFRGRIILEYEGQELLLQEFAGNVLSDHIEQLLRKFMENKWGYDPGGVMLHDVLCMMAAEHAFDPVLDYLAEVQASWDGVSRLETAAIVYFNAEDTRLNREIIKTMLIASVRRARWPGCKFDNICVLEGREGIRKSTAIRTLYGRTYFTDQSLLGKDERTAQELLQGVWGVEAAELSGMTRADVEHVKSFASRLMDKGRPAYGRNSIDQPRRCVIWGSTNDDRYLVSQTGNRRFWPLAITKPIDIGKLTADRDQLWAEAAVLESHLPRDIEYEVVLPPGLWGAAGDAQEARRGLDPWEDTLQNIPESYPVYDAERRQTVDVPIMHRTGAPQWLERVETRVLLERVFTIGPALQTPSHVKRLGQVMKRLGWQNPAGGFYIKGVGTVRGYVRPDPSATQQETLALGPVALARQDAA